MQAQGIRHATVAALLLLVAVLLSGCGGADSAEDASDEEHPGHQPGMTHSPGMTHGSGHEGATEPGHAGFGAVQGIVQILEADPETDWTRVNITALRDHLLDMDALFNRASVSHEYTADGFVATVTGEEDVLAAAGRMVPAHVETLSGRAAWSFNVTVHDGSVTVVANGATSDDAVKLQGLGFFGVMATDSHHQAHHVMIALGEPMH